MAETSEGLRKFRRVTGFWKIIEKILLIAIPVSGILFILEVHLYVTEAFFRQQFLAIFLGLVLASVFLGVPATRGASSSHVPWYDVLLAAAGFGTCIFNSIIYPQYILSGPVYIGLESLILGSLAILLVAEATRRMGGWVLVVLLGFFVFYARFNFLLPAPFYGKGIPWNRLAVYLFLDINGVLGLPLWVTGSIIFCFIVFGQFLFATGGARLLTDFSLVTMGRFRGGAAKMAVVGSSLFGTISGSAVANVTATGTMTIPMMKDSGYKPEVAGAIEATASTGGQLLPPVMGVTAFIVAEILEVPYSKVAIAAFIPAVLFYLMLFMQVDLEAAKTGLRGLSENPPPIRPILRESWVFICPLIVLVYTLFVLNFQPGKSAIMATALVFILSLIRKKTRVGFRKLLHILEATGRGILEIGTITATAGIIVGIIYITGLGTTISHILLKVGGESLFLMLVYSAIVSIILGMGMPTAPVYIILAVLVAPALVQLGVLPMAAHLFIFYFGVISMITPPVCIASYAAAAVAGSNPMKTGFHGLRLGISAFIVPFIFVYTPTLLLEGSFHDILLSIVKTSAGLAFLAIAFNGFLFRDLNVTKRILIGLGAIALLMPPGTGYPIPLWFLNIAGLGICLLIIVWERIKGSNRESAGLGLSIPGTDKAPEKRI